MRFLRAHLRMCVAVWLMCQLASLSAFAQPSCCAAHDVATAGEPDCHENAVCPMHGGTQVPPADGDLCPMHSGGGSDADCVMRSTCNGPAVALGALLTVPGVLPGTVAVTTVPSVSPVDPVRFVATGHPTSHDTPPPRL